MKKRLLSGLVLLALLQCLMLPAFAEPTDAPADPTEPSASETVADATEPDASEPGATDAAEPTAETAAPAENDKAPAAVTDETPPALNDFGQYLDTTVQARAAALVELNSDTLVYGMNLDEKVYPASLTKIMTCMLALEHGNLDDIVTVSHEALQDLNAAGSSAGLLEGEQLSLRELLYCVMISSANEACNVVAEYIAGDIPSFVALMNAQAAALGMTGTHFANAHGLHDENHYTTVRDLVTLARWAWQSEQFQEFSTQTSHTVPATNKSEERVLRTTNYLTSGQTVGKYYYDKARRRQDRLHDPCGRLPHLHGGEWFAAFPQRRLRLRDAAERRRHGDGPALHGDEAAVRIRLQSFEQCAGAGGHGSCGHAAGAVCRRTRQRRRAREGQHLRSAGRTAAIPPASR